MATARRFGFLGKTSPNVCSLWFTITDMECDDSCFLTVCGKNSNSILHYSRNSMFHQEEHVMC